MKKILILLFTLFVTLLVSCDVVIEDKEYAVTFDILGNTTQAKVKDGDTLKEDQIPNTDIIGMEFQYWARVENDTDFIFDLTKPIRQDYEIYARYQDISGLNEITISLHGPNGNIVFAEAIPTNSVYRITYDTDESGYTFVGWYLDSGFNTPYSEITLTQDTNIYGKWVEVDVTTYTVTFIGRTGEQFSKVTVEEGKTVSKPTNTNISGYRFINWYTSSSFTTVFNFNTSITSNITIYGKWEVNGGTGDHYEYTGNYYNGISTSNTSQIKNLISVTPDSYDQAKTTLQYADQDPDNHNNILTVYNRASLKGPWTSGGTVWNREHVWPKSKCSGTAEHDTHNLRAADNRPGSTINNQRGNVAFGSGSGECGKVGGYWWPGNFDKGDVARISMYMAFRWSMSLSTNIPVNLALQWHEEDPVDFYEMNRNDVIEDYQGNRNPFVDIPELAFTIYG